MSMLNADLAFGRRKASSQAYMSFWSKAGETADGKLAIDLMAVLHIRATDARLAFCAYND
jgi:hypothetical protein